MEARRQRAEQRLSRLRGLFERIGVGALSAWALFFMGAVVAVLWGGEALRWRLGEVVQRDITARVPFTILNTTQTQHDRDVARAGAPNVYVANAQPLERIRGRLAEMLELTKAHGHDPARFKAEAEKRGWALGDAEREALINYTQEQNAQAFSDAVDQLINRLRPEYIVSRSEDALRKPPSSKLRHEDGSAPDVPSSELIVEPDREKVRQIAHEVVTAVEGVPAPLKEPFATVVVHGIIGRPDAKTPEFQPLWLFDPAATAQEMEAAASRVPESKIEMQAGALLVPAGTELSDADLSRLKTEHAAFLRAQDTDPKLRRERMLERTGMGAVLLMLTLGFAVYTARFEPRIFHKPARSFSMMGLLLLAVVLARGIEHTQYPWDLPSEFTVVLVFTAVALLTIAYNQRFAMTVAAFLAVVTTLTVRGELGLLITLAATAGTVVYLLNEVRTRTKLIVVGMAAAVVAFVASSATGLIAGQELTRYVLPHAVAAGASAALAGFIVQGILPSFERFFGIATSMTLLEWCDASKPMLRRLAQEAPGTYSHSLVLSQMAEEAAESIGVRGLLTRVGALYHDIGKIQKAEYFAENQEARMNRHDRLSPTMSLLIIVGHVKDGMEMARAYGLPRVLLPFIAEHHGTTIVKCFHHAASEAAAKNKGRHDREVPDSEFRYPGPKPKSKETAILMLCDGCESAVRSLGEPTPGRIESMIHQVVMDRLNDGQFDDCDITLRELKVVETSLVKSLCAIHHGRIKYPKAAPSAGGGDEAGQESPPPKRDGEKSPLAKGSAPRQPEVARQA